MTRYVLSNEALTELDEIWLYIAQDDVDAADRWIAKLLDSCEMLARNPGVGHRRPEVADNSVLLWPVGKYLITYRPHPDHVEIVGLTEGSRDLPSYLRKRS